jgi:hypothetical protein
MSNKKETPRKNVQLGAVSVPVVYGTPPPSGPVAQNPVTAILSSNARAKQASSPLTPSVPLSMHQEDFPSLSSQPTSSKKKATAPRPTNADPVMKRRVFTSS